MSESFPLSLLPRRLSALPQSPSCPRLIYGKLKTRRAPALAARPQCAAAVTQICFPSNQVTLRVSLVMSRVVLVGSFNCAGRSHGRSQPFPVDDLKNRREAGSACRGPRGSPTGRVGRDGPGGPGRALAAALARGRGKRPCCGAEPRARAAALVLRDCKTGPESPHLCSERG